MAIEYTLREHLLAQSAITNIVTGVFVGIIPQGTLLPVILINRDMGGPVYSLQGESGLDMTSCIVELLVDKGQVTTLISLQEAVRTALSGYRGSMGTTYPLKIQRIMLMNVRGADLEPDSEAHVRRMEFEIDYNP